MGDIFPLQRPKNAGRKADAAHTSKNLDLNEHQTKTVRHAVECIQSHRHRNNHCVCQWSCLGFVGAGLTHLITVTARLLQKIIACRFIFMLLDTLLLYQFAGTATDIQRQTKGPSSPGPSLRMIKCRCFVKGIRTGQAFKTLFSITFNLPPLESQGPLKTTVALVYSVILKGFLSHEQTHPFLNQCESFSQHLQNPAGRRSTASVNTWCEELLPFVCSETVTPTFV